MSAKINSGKWWNNILGRWKENGDNRDRPSEFSQLASFIREGSILEVGFGTGAFCKYLKPTVQYFGIDISDSMVKEARAQHPSKVFLELDILNMNVAKWENAFDFACAFQTLEHFPRERFTTIIKNIRKISKGGLMFSVPRGLPTKADYEADGHCIGWKTFSDFVKEVSDIVGAVGAEEVVTSKNHIAGVITWAL